MKQIINKEDKAVSPIIATILLIAITVVLAATLYTVLGGFTKGLSSGNPTASISFNGKNSNYTIAFSTISGNVSMSSLSLQITNGTHSPETVSLAGSYNSGSATLTTGSGAASTDSYYYVNVTGANGGYLASTTVILISGHDNGNRNNVTSISIADKTTNSTLVGSTTPSPSIIVAQAVFRND